MPRKPRASTRSVWIFALFLLAGSRAAAQWSAVPGAAAGEPSAATFSWQGIERVFVASVDAAGQAEVRLSDPGSGTRLSGGPYLPGPPVSLEPATAPVLVRERATAKGAPDTLHLFARARGDLYRASLRADQGSWTGWTRVWLDGAVAGPFSVVVTAGPPGTTVTSAPAEFHFAFRSWTFSPPIGWVTTVEYRRLDALGGFARRGLGLGLDGRLAWDGAGTVGLIVRGSASVALLTLRREGTGGWAWASSARLAPEAGAVYDVSNLVYYNRSFHFACALRESRASEFGSNTFEELRHVRFPASGGSWTGASIFPVRSGASGLRGALERYRGRLFAAYRDPEGAVRVSRWDTADPALPWVGGEPVGGASDRASGRPALAVLDGRGRVTVWHARGWGNDLLAVVKDASSSVLRAANVSRERARVEVGKQMALYNAYILLGGACYPQGSPRRVDLSLEGRPFLSELGADLAAMPHWLGGFLFKRMAEEQSCPSSYFQEPCSEAKQPVVLQCPGAGIFVNDGNSMWLGVENDDRRIFEELGHTLASAIGLRDDGFGGPPAAADATRSRIPLEELERAYTLFGEPSSRCPDVPSRCLGFTDSRYETLGSPSRQHHFLYTVRSYVWQGADLRLWVSADSGGSNHVGETHWTQRELLRRKYDWIRRNVFRGVEFQNGGEPLTAF